MSHEVALRQEPRLLDRVRREAFEFFGRPDPGERYAQWITRFVLFHQKRHPRDLSRDDIWGFLVHVSRTEKEPIGCLEQAHEALTFLYAKVLHLDLGDLPVPEPPKLLDRLRFALRARHYSPRTEDCYAEWATRYIRFHGLRHPK